MLGIFGGADVSIPLENVKAFESALRQAGVESTVTVYPNQPHAFIKDAEGIKAGGAQGAAWSQMLRFFQGALRSPSATPGATNVPPQAAGDFYGWIPVLRLALGHSGPGGHGSPWDNAAH